MGLIQHAIVKLLPLRWTIGAVANEFDLLKIGALLPGHHPSIKDGLPLKLRKEKKSGNKRVTVQPVPITLHLGPSFEYRNLL